MTEDQELKLIYVNKIGYNSMGQGNYEFVFSKHPEEISDEELQEWNWYERPACGNVYPPDKSQIDMICELRTDLFNLKCLHEANDRPYIHGYYNIHCLAYEDDEEQEEHENEESLLFDDFPLLVFHFGATLERVKDILYERDVVLRNNSFVYESKTDILK
jgi:hypothetical protein